MMPYDTSHRLSAVGSLLFTKIKYRTSQLFPKTSVKGQNFNFLYIKTQENNVTKTQQSEIALKMSDLFLL